MTLFPSQDSFVRGELSPRLHSRASLDLYKAGLSRCENFITLPHGGLRKRGGTYFVGEVADSTKNTRLIPFVFSDDQAYALEVGHLYIRVYAYGARVGTVHVTTPFDVTEIAGIKYAQSADDMWLVHPNHEPQKLTRNSHTSWSLSAVSFTDGPFQPVNTSAITLYASATAGSGITITASAALFTAEMVGRLVRIDMESYEDIEPWEPGALITQPTVGSIRRYEGRVYSTPTVYDDAAHEARTGGTPPTHTRGTEWDGAATDQVVSDIPTGAGTVSQADVYRGLQWTYLHSGYGVARITGFTNSTTVTADVLSAFPAEVVGSGNASEFWRLGAFDDGAFPESVEIFEERLCYGQRFSVFASKTGDFESFETGAKADDALAFTLAGGGRANDIVSLLEIDGYLGIATIGGFRSLSGAGIDEALTPSSFKNRNSRTMGCSYIQPVQAGQSYVYVGKGRKKLAELRLGQQLRFESDDLGQISEHIPKKGIVEIAFQENPDPILWFPLDNGELGGFTHQPSQEVRGMHRHRLGGTAGSGWGAVESVCVTPGQTGEEDVWHIVRRTIGGATKRYIEIQTPAFEYGDIEDAFCVDCGLSYDGAATAMVTGAVHLAGQTVDVLAGGKVYRGRPVTAGGTVSLPSGSAAATPWHLGLPFESGADTLELDVGGRDGSLMGRKKKVTRVILSLLETDLSGLEITSLQRTRWEPVRLPSIAPQPSSAVLYTGNVEVPIDDSWEGQGRVRIRHTNPTPCTIRAMTPAFDSEP